MTTRIVRSGVARFDVFALDIREEGGNVTTVIDATPEIDAARAFHGQRVRVTIELEPPPPEPLTGGPADINVRVRIKRDWLPGSAISGRVGVLARYDRYGHADIMVEEGGCFVVPVDQIERAPAECPHCGASRVAR